MLPGASVHGPVGALRQLRVRPLELHRDFLELLVGLDPHHLPRGRLGAGHLPAQELRDRARAREPEALGVDPELRELLPRERVPREHAAALLHLPRQLEQAVERDPEPHLEAEAQRQALVHERRDADLPALVDAPEDLRLVDAHVVEEDLVELGIARDLPERLHRDARELHVEQKVGDPLVPGRAGVGPREQHHPVGHLGERGPYLLAVDDPGLAVSDRARLERGEVGARVRLGVALAPDLLAREDPRRVALLLRLGPVGDDGGAGHADAEDVQDRRRLRERDLLLEDQLLDEREAAAAVLLGPREADEPGVVEPALPLLQDLVRLDARDVGAAEVLPLARQALLEPGADRLAERVLFGSQREVHFPSWDGAIRSR